MELAQKPIRIINVGGLKASYREINPEGEHTIVMLRGFRTSDEGLMPLAQLLHGYHLIIPDLPGYGQTEELSTGNTITGYAEFVARFCAELNLRDFTVLGHSLGAQVGLVYASTHPLRVRSLVMISPIPRPNLVSKAVSLYYQIGRALPRPLRRSWLSNRTIHQPIRQFIVRTDDPVLRQQIMLEGERELRELRPNVNVENFLSLVSTDPKDYIPGLHVPTLALAGNFDRLTRLSDVIDTYQDDHIDLKVIDGMGHYGPAEMPHHIAQVVQMWLDPNDLLTPITIATQSAINPSI